MKQTDKPSIKVMLELCIGISNGIAYLHNSKPAIIHRDMKSLNILIDDSRKPKIADFGLSKTRGKVKERMHTVVGTINWQAPEVCTILMKY